MSKIKCISLWQPWASLIAIGAKKVETRSWPIKYRGPIAIHAAKRWTRQERETCACEPFDSVLRSAGLIIGPNRITKTFVEVQHTTFPLGAIVAVAELVDCAQFGADVSAYSRQERAFGDFTARRYGWILNNVRALQEPLPYRGEQGLFEIDPLILGDYA